MLRQLPGDTEATGLGKFSHQSPRYREITSRELASADHPRFGRLRPSAIHSTPTLTQLRKQRKRKSVAVVLDNLAKKFPRKNFLITKRPSDVLVWCLRNN